MTEPHLNPWQQNRSAWNARAQQGDFYSRPANDRDFAQPLKALDECGWLGGTVAGKSVLCLAAGGGRHGPLFAAAGARVTVVDISPAMLQLDRDLAAARGLRVQTVEASMDNLSALGAAHFDIVIQPVSSCYVPDVTTVYREVAKVTVPGGLYISQHKQPGSLQAEAGPAGEGYFLREPYYRRGPLPPPTAGACHREAGTTEFLHRWEDLLGGLCRSGFVVEDLVEPRHASVHAEPGSLAHRSYYLPPFVTLKARRLATPMEESPKLWTP